jgi:DNA polymerase-1
VADDILAWRKAIKFKGQYADGILGYVQDDGRVHCHYNIDGAESGRPSANDPNMLNIPARGPNAAACRGIFVAEDGYMLLEGDYSQVELRVAAMLSGDPVMIQMFKDGVDFHTATSVMIAPLLGVDSTDQTAMDALRGQSKIVNFALLYGDPDEGLAHKLGCDVRTAAKLRAAILGKFKRLAKWIDECQAATRRSGVCRTVWNGEDRRVRKLYDVADPNAKGHDTAVRSSWNTPVQGSATEYTNASLGAIQAWLDEHPAVPARLVLTVYDSIMLEVHEDWVEDVAHVVKDIMESWPSSGVPIVSELKVGKDWGHMAKLKLAA